MDGPARHSRYTDLRLTNVTGRRDQSSNGEGILRGTTHLHDLVVNRRGLGGSSVAPAAPPEVNLPGSVVPVHNPLRNESLFGYEQNTRFSRRY